MDDKGKVLVIDKRVEQESETENKVHYLGDPEAITW